MMSGTFRRISAWAPVLLYCVLIYIQSAFPSPAQLPRFYGADKLLHVVAYAALGWLFMRAFWKSDLRITAKKAFMCSFSLTLLYGASDECHQFFVAARQADVMDVLADAVGGACGAAVYLWRYRVFF